MNWRISRSINHLQALALLLVLTFFVSAGAAGQDFEAIRATKKAVALRVSEPIHIDGVMDEPAWERADPVGDFFQQYPDEFKPATRRTEVRFLYDESVHHGPDVRKVSSASPLLKSRFRSFVIRRVGSSLRFRLNAHLAASGTFARSIVTLPQGSFTGDLVGLRIDTSFTPRMFLNAFIQYNGETDAWLSNVRFNLIHRPLSDIYVVWNETRLPLQAQRALLLRYTQLLAF